MEAIMAKGPKWIDLARIAYTGSKDKAVGQRAETIVEIIGKKTKASQIRNKTIVNVINTLKDRGLSNATINRHLSVLSKVASVYRRSYDPTYTLYIPWQKEGSGRFEWLSKSDEEKLLPHLSPELQLIVRVLVTTGMRLGELLSLESSQVEDDWIRLWETKTNRPRSVPITADIAQQLRQLIDQGLPQAWQIRRGLSEALKASGVNSRITPHSLRHTTATRLVKSGANLMVVQRYLGHNSINTTQRYVHIEDKDIRDAMSKITS